MQILITTLAVRTITLEVKSTDTIDYIKSLLHQANIPPAQQRLIFAGRLLEDVRTIADYGILDGSSLRMELHISGGVRIYVKTTTTPTNTIALEVQLTHSISQVKQQVHELDGIAPHQQRLYFCGKPLEDHCILADYGVQSESTLHLVPLS